MRVLVLNNEYPPIGGGSSPVTAGLCEEMARQGTQVDVVTMAYDDLDRVERNGNLVIHRVPCLRSARHISFVHELLTYSVSAFLKSSKLVRANRYDLVHSHFIVPGGLVALWLKARFGLPFVITSHGSDVPEYNPDRFRRLHRWIAPLWRRVVAQAAVITSPSELLASLIRKATLLPIDLKIIPNAIDPSWNQPSIDGKTILVVSRLLERKGVQYLLEALKQSPIDREIHIVGDGPFRQELEKSAGKLHDQVTFHGWVKNDAETIKELYRDAFIFVFLSEAENFPVCLLEAMVSGNAIIASNIPGCREVLGDAAVFVPPRDSDSLAAALAALSRDSDHARRLGALARQRATQEFSWEVVGRKYVDLFEKVNQSSGA